MNEVLNTLTQLQQGKTILYPTETFLWTIRYVPFQLQAPPSPSLGSPQSSQCYIPNSNVLTMQIFTKITLEPGCQRGIVEVYTDTGTYGCKFGSL